VGLVVGLHPGEELQDLLGAPRGSRVRKQRPRIPFAGDQILVELEALGPVLLQRHAAKAQLLHEQAHDPMLEGELLMGAMRGFPEPHHLGVAHHLRQWRKIGERRRGVGGSKRRGMLADPGGHSR